MGLAGSFRTIEGKEIHSVRKETAASWCEEDGWFMESISVLWEAWTPSMPPYSIPLSGQLMETMGSLCTVLSFGDVSLLVAPLLWTPRSVCTHLEWLTMGLQGTPTAVFIALHFVMGWLWDPELLFCPLL